ncbi:transforming growth factor beta receptor type 3 [Nematolebias whitei]|uniref:transforming growth factor beta receptor type 3 n=1 Tax=Nematolebias whitei TaxID=451745 RepID=UPI001898208C|nr:transforming growth factor beta receptor type 3 [Nematolebias whitei]
MPSLTMVLWSAFCLHLLWDKLTAPTRVCSPTDPMGAQHPVLALLERFQTIQGCVAREHGHKETHVVALERGDKSSENKLRTIHLVLSSKHRVSWLLEAQQLPPNLPVFVQVSANSSVESHALRLHVRTVHLLPSRPRPLHRWALKHHGNLSSLMYTKRGNRVYIQLGEDPTRLAECQLQSSFSCPSFTITDLQPQKVWGCIHPTAGDASPEVHVIHLRSAGSERCSSQRTEVIVSLVSPVVSLKEEKVVLILSSSVPVSWVITAHDVRGHISVHSSSGVSPPFPAEPNLTLSSTLNSDLSDVSDLLVWANESGYLKVTSYTEAHLANRFVIHLTEGRTGRESLRVNCEDGLLSMTVDQQLLQGLSVPVAAVTLQDHKCQALSNGSHFLLTLPVIFCGTEAELVEEPRGVLYRNRVFLWRNKPQTIKSLEERNFNPPLSMPISCFAASPSRSAADGDIVALPLVGRFTRGVNQGPESVPGLGHLPFPRHRSEPVVDLKLFVSESYEQTWIGPCVIPAGQRVFVEISAKASFVDGVQVRSCFVSPLSDPKKSPFWTVISNGCSSNPSLTFDAKTKSKEEDKDEDEGEDEEETAETDGWEKGRNHPKEIKSIRMDNDTQRVAEEEIRFLRFSFILRPVFKEPMQFLHVSLQLCLSNSTRGPPMKEAVKEDCQTETQIPALITRSSRQQCGIRNLSRPMVVTQPIGPLAPKVPPPNGQRTNRLSVAPVADPDPETSSLGVQTGPLMGIVFAAFVIGVSLMGGLWCIYNFTGISNTSPKY